jgi:hypothetical protein
LPQIRDNLRPFTEKEKPRMNAEKRRSAFFRIHPRQKALQKLKRMPVSNLRPGRAAVA